MLGTRTVYNDIAHTGDTTTILFNIHKVKVFHLSCKVTLEELQAHEAVFFLET